LEQHACSLAALKNVGVQAVVTEFLISHADILFTDSFLNRRREHAAGYCIIAACFFYLQLIILKLITVINTALSDYTDSLLLSVGSLLSN